MPAKLNGENGAAAHAEAQQDRRQKGHQRIGGADRGERVRAQKTAYDQGVRHIIELLEQIAEHHR